MAAFITAFLGSAGGYAYAHAVMVAGVIVTAVGDELVIAHPTGHVATATALCVLGGAALFAAGMVLFLISTGGLDHAERVMTALWFAAVAVLGLAAAQASPLTLAIVTTALLYALVAGAAWHARQEGEPVPLEEAI